MNDAELRAAAERLRDGAYPAIDLPPWATRVYRDGAAVAAAWLAEHPADDAEPVTEEWLRSVGFSSRPNNRWLQIRTPQGGRLDCWMASPLWEFHDEAVAIPQTRGDVRRLCTALGIDLAPSGEK